MALADEICQSGIPAPSARVIARLFGNTDMSIDELAGMVAGKASQSSVDALNTAMSSMHENELVLQAMEQRDLMSLESKAALTALKETEALWREGLLTSSEKLEAVNRNETAAANLSLAEYRYQVAAATMQDVMGLSGKE